MRPAIICVDDQREVLAALLKDLTPLADEFDVIECDSADEAFEAMDEFDADGVAIALVISDHVMPHCTGVEFLRQVHLDSRFRHTGKVLLTGLATHKDTINAINQAQINAYIEKPWTEENLLRTLRCCLTRFILDTHLDYSKFPHALDQDLLLQHMHKNA